MAEKKSESELKFVYTVTHNSPLLPRHFVCNDMVACNDVVNGKPTDLRLDIRVDGIRGGLDAVLAALPEDKRTVPPLRMRTRGRNWVTPSPTNRQAKRRLVPSQPLEVDESLVTYDDEMEDLL
jgi:hypothetical protein